MGKALSQDADAILSHGVKDLDLERRTLTVRQGKGGKDRVTVVAATSEPLTFNVER
jgi:hypothetical protein